MNWRDILYKSLAKPLKTRGQRGQEKRAEKAWNKREFGSKQEQILNKLLNRTLKNK